MLEVIKGLEFDFVFDYCITKYPLYVTSAQATTEDTLYII